MMPQTWKGTRCSGLPGARHRIRSFVLWTKGKDLEDKEALTTSRKTGAMKRGTENQDFMFLNLGEPPVCARCVPIYSAAGRRREIVDRVPDIGYHHRRQKMVSVNPGTAHSGTPTPSSILRRLRERNATCWRSKLAAYKGA